MTLAAITAGILLAEQEAPSGTSEQVDALRIALIVIGALAALCLLLLILRSRSCKSTDEKAE